MTNVPLRALVADPPLVRDLDQLLFFSPNRVWRCYTGGLLLDRFLGGSQPRDGHFPEEWLASATLAENGERSQGPEEGLSRIRRSDDALGDSPGTVFRDVVGDERMPVLCKFLDSAVRLPIQCHPDRAFAREHYRSGHGKTESWLILDTRTIDGVEPYLLIGFKPGISAEAFARAVEVQDVPALEAMLNRIPVRPGDAYLIPGRVPHAIGPGVLMLEVQEPSDWVVQVERSCAGTSLNDRDRWGPLSPTVAMTCFDYRGEPACALRKRLAMVPITLSTTATATHQQLQATTCTDAFRIDQLVVTGPYRFETDLPRHIGIVTAGAGRVACGGQEHRLERGSTYYASSRVGSLEFVPDQDAPLTITVVTAGIA